MNTSMLPNESLVPPENGKKSVSQQLLELAHEHFRFATDQNGKPFGYRLFGHIALPLSGGPLSVRAELTGLYAERMGRPPANNALTEALEVLRYEAARSGDPVQVHLRAARVSDDELLIDVGDHAQQVIRVSPNGWEMLEADDEIPVFFRRTRVTGALPFPEQGGDLERLWEFINLPSEQDREIFKGWLVAAVILVGVPTPILAILGEQGTAKTTSIRRMFSLFDPSSAPVRRPPNDIDRLLHAAAHGRSVAFDNLSSIPRWLSDGLCRVVTGEADVDRALYTDDDVRIVKVQGVLGFTGIDVGALAGDLADRCVWGDLEVIPPSARRSERELDAAWNEAYPGIVGGLLDLAVKTLNALPTVKLTEKPRMADFAEVLAAMDIATDSTSLTSYLEAQRSVATDIVDTDVFIQALAQVITKRWHGTAKELHEMLPKASSEKYWPTARGTAGKLRRSAPDLRKAGWTVTEHKANPSSKRAAAWELHPPEAQIAEVDLIGVSLAYDHYRLDQQKWVRLLIADGATANCAPQHADDLRYGGTRVCGEPGCTASPVYAQYAAHAANTRAVESHYFDFVRKLGLTSSEVEKLVAERNGVDSRAA